jgi:hypothetical protein
MGYLKRVGLLIRHLVSCLGTVVENNDTIPVCWSVTLENWLQMALLS